MKPGRKPQMLTEKELVIMQMLWERGPLFVREMVNIHEEPKPHFNTLSTIVRILEEKSHVKNAVAAPDEEEKMSDEELREVMDLIERKNAKK